MSDRPLREYQSRAVAAVRDAMLRRKRRVCLVLPTGGGKTRVGGEVALQHLSKASGRAVLWTAHRTELIYQARSSLIRDGADRVGVIAASAGDEFEDLGAPIQVASIQTLAARGLRPPATLLVLDECHHYPADDWGEVARHYASSRTLGLTATPERSDGRPLDDLFDELVAPVSVAELQSLGHLVQCQVLAPPKRLTAALAGDPVERYIEMAKGRRAFFFCATVDQAETMALKLIEAGIPAACVHGATPPDQRKRSVQLFREGALMALTNVYVFTEGTDVPEAEVAVLCRGFGHASTLIQCMGRVLRPAPGKGDALILDLMGSTRIHGGPSDAREYSLTGEAIALAGKQSRKKRDESDDSQPMEAPEIDRKAKLEIVEACNVARKRWMRSSVGSDQPERKAWEQLTRIAAEKGYKPGWAAHRFKSRFEKWPWQVGLTNNGRTSERQPTTANSTGDGAEPAAPTG